MTSTTTTRLRALDPADAVVDPALRARLDARVLSLPATLADTPPVVPVPTRPTRPTRSRTTRRRVALLGGVAAAVAAGSVVLPALVGGNAAYASWTGTPSTVAPAELDAVVAACRDQLDGGWLPWDTSPLLDTATADVAVAERRGGYVAVLLRPSGGADLSAFCVATLPPGSGEVSDVETGMAGSSGPAATAGPTQFLEGSMAQFGGDRPAAFVDGVAGGDVVGVRIHDSAGTTVDATVSGGRYAAWWPGTVVGDGSVRETGGNGGPAPQLRYDVTLRDGTIVLDATPARPTWQAS